MLGSLGRGTCLALRHAHLHVVLLHLQPPSHPPGVVVDKDITDSV